MGETSNTSQTEQPRIYVACHAAYKDGILHGAWGVDRRRPGNIDIMGWGGGHARRIPHRRGRGTRPARALRSVQEINASRL